MAVLPPAPVSPRSRPETALAWDRHLLTAIPPAGAAALRSLDPRSSMAALLSQAAPPRPWADRTGALARHFRRPDAECHRLILLAESQGWLTLQAAGPMPSLGLRDALGRTGLLSEGRLTALDRRLAAGQALAVDTVAAALQRVGWLDSATAATLSRMGRQAQWHWG
jgi:hypothetical protein